MGVRCRCRRWACQARVTLARRPESYVREPKCSACKGALRVDRYRSSGKEAKKGNCFDSRCGYLFIHRRGSKWCYHNPKRESLDWSEYEDLMASMMRSMKERARRNAPGESDVGSGRMRYRG